MLVDRRRTRAAAGASASTGFWRDPLMAVIAVVVLASAVLSGIWVYRAGHSGAESVWSKVQVTGEGGEGGEEGG